MTPDVVLSLGREAGTIALLVAGPLLGAGLAVGIAVSVFQAVTQIQEASLSFIPKIAAMGLVAALLGHWMLGQMVTYTVRLLTNLNALAQ